MLKRIGLLGLLLVALAPGLLAQGGPPTPTNLTPVLLQSGSDVSVELSWESSQGMWMYKVYRSDGDNANFKHIGVPTINRKYIDNNVLAGVKYYYYVTSIDASLKESAPSNTASITLPGTSTVGKVQGTVTDEGTGAPIPNVTIQIMQQDVSEMTWVQVATGGDGKYSALVPVGKHVIHAIPSWPSGYKEEWFDNSPDEAGATPVTVTENSTFTANFQLVKKVAGPQGTIRGTILDEVTLAPIEGVRVHFFRNDTPAIRVAMAVTNSSGVYEASLDVGTYLLRAAPPIWEPGAPLYMPEWYDNVTDVSQATLVEVKEGLSFTANFSLTPLKVPDLVTVEGIVTDADGKPLEGAAVVFMRSIQDMHELFAITGEIPGLGHHGIFENLGYCRGVMGKDLTDAQGHYQIHVPAGMTYVAAAVKMGYLPEFYDNKSNPMDADLIEVKGDMTGIDFSLAAMPSLANSVSGKVVDEEGNGIPSRIILLPLRPVPAHLFVRFGNTNENGEYKIENVFEHNYLVLAVPYSEFAPAFYKEGAFGVIHWQEADTVEVSGAVTGIDIGVVPIDCFGLATLNGRVTTSGGAGLGGVNVFVTSPEGAVLGYGLTDEAGTYSIPSVPTSNVVVVADKEGYLSTPQLVEVTSMTYSAPNLVMTEVGGTTSVGPEPTAPVEYQLGQNYPNPFNPTTSITFAMPEAGVAKMSVYNLLGQEIVTLVDGMLPAGSHQVVWNGRDNAGRTLTSGIYLYKLNVTGESGKSEFSQVRKMVLMK